MGKPHLLKFKKLFSSVLFVSAVAILSACSSTPVPQNNDMNVLLSASSDVNPDVNGASSPVCIEIYELKDVDDFQNADYYSLMGERLKSLKNNIANMQEVVLQPGTTQSLNITPRQGVVALGFVAAYRDIDNADWMDVYKLKKKEKLAWYQKEKKPVLKVSVQKLAIAVSDQEAN